MSSEQSGAQQLGRVAVERGLITAEQLTEAVAEMARRRAAGSQVPLGEFLVAMGYITRHQLEGLLEVQGGRRSPAQQIEGYELISRLGTGGMGAVYLARQLSLDRLVALKVLRPQLSRDPAYVDRFLREARLAGKLDHENVVRAIDVGESGGYHYLAMEYVEGRSVSELTPPGEALPEPFALRVALQVARGLEHARRHGIVHRDIKPDNILIDSKGVAKLADLGLAKQMAAHTQLTQTGMVFGTADYMSPEQARGDVDVDARSDIYSLGATLYHLVTGRTPFTGSNALVVLNKHISEQAPWPAEVNPAVTPQCSALIARMMAKDPDERYPGPAEMIADIERVIAGQSPAAAPPGPGRSSLDTPAAARSERPAPARRPGHARRHARSGSPEETDATRPLAGVPGRLNLPLTAVLAAAAVLLLMGLAAGLLMRGPGGGQPPAGQERFRALYAEAEKLREAGLAEEAVTRFEQLRKEAAGTGWEVLAAKAVDELRRAGRPEDAPAPGPGPEANAKFRGMYEAAGRHRDEHPDDFAGALQRFEELRSQAGGTQWAGRAAEAIEALEAERDRAAEAVLAPLRKRAGELAAAGDFDAAAAVFGEPAGALAGVLKPRFEVERRRLAELADEKLGAAMDAAERHSREGRPDEGLAELDKVAGVKCAAWNDRLSKLRGRIEKEKADDRATRERRLKADAAAALAAILDGFEDRALAGDGAGAAAFLAERRGKLEAGQLPLVAADLAAAERLAGLLRAEEARRAAELGKLRGRRVELALRDGKKVTGKVLESTDAGLRLEVTSRDGAAVIVRPQTVSFAELAPGEAVRLVPPLKPGNPDGHLAAAVLWMSSGPHGPASEALRRAEAELAAAGEHRLAPRWAKRLAALKIDPRETAAQQAWDESIAKLILAKYTAAEAETLAAALDAFARDHGDTEFARSKAAEISGLRLAAGDETEKIRQLFRGQVVRFDPKTLEIELLWDFSSAEQLADFRAAAGRPEIRDGKLVLASKALLSCRAAFDSQLRVAWEWEPVGSGNSGMRFVAGSDNVCVLQLNSQLAVVQKEKIFAYLPLRRNPAARLSGRHLTVELDGKSSGKAVGLPAGRAVFELFSVSTDSRFDNVRATGTLDRAWLKQALGRPGKGGTIKSTGPGGQILWEPARY